jgi:hypothetical protein
VGKSGETTSFAGSCPAVEITLTAVFMAQPKIE